MNANTSSTPLLSLTPDTMSAAAVRNNTVSASWLTASAEDPEPGVMVADIADRDTKPLWFEAMLYRKTSKSAFPSTSPAARFVALLWNRIQFPESLTAIFPDESPFAEVLAVPAACETSVVVEPARAKKKRSATALLSDNPASTLVDVLAYATRAPSADIADAKARPFPVAVALAAERDTSRRTAVARS